MSTSAEKETRNDDRINRSYIKKTTSFYQSFDLFYRSIRLMVNDLLHNDPSNQQFVDFGG